MLIGSHVSFTKDKQLLGSVLESISYNSTTFMFYTGAPQNTMRAKIDDNLTKEAIKLMKEHNIDPNTLVVHAPYLINLATIKNRDFAISFFKQEIDRVLSLGVKKLIIHPGSHVGIGVEEGINQIIDGLNEGMKDNDIIICIESMSKKGTEIGTIDELAKIYGGCNYKDRLQICLDTCHLHDAGYDVAKFDDIIDMVESLMGKDKIGCLHVNDSKNVKGSSKDRHANIGEGEIGLNVLKAIVSNKRLVEVPKILETPWKTDTDGKSYAPYKEEIKLLTNVN